MDIKYVPTTCPYCGTGCSLYLIVQNGRVTGVAPATRSPVNMGKLCPRGMSSWRFVNSPNRLTQPLIRKNGILVPVSWSEAISFIVDKIQSYCPSEFCVLSSPRTSNEDNYVMMKFARGVLKTNHIDHCERLCHASIVQPLSDSFGCQAMTGNIPDISMSQTIFVIGSNAFAQHPLIGRQIVLAQKRGATYICADPRRTFTGSGADLLLQFHAGTDILLLNGIMQEILRNGWENTEFIAEHTRGFSEFKKSIMNPAYAVPKVSTITGVPEDSIIRAAYLLSQPGCTIVYSTGITKHGDSIANIHSIANLQLLTGNIGKPGTGVDPLRGQNNIQGACDMGAQPFYFTGYQRVDDDAAYKKFADRWGFPDGIAPPVCGYEITKMIDVLASGSGELKAMYIMGENPVLSDIDVNHAKTALRNLEFLVVQDIFLNETCEFADVVLPAACFAERDGTQTNTERRVQRWHKAVSPPGDAKTDWRILADIATALGYADQFSWASYDEIFTEIALLTPQYAGINYNRLTTPDGIQWPCPNINHPGTPHLYSEKFATPDGRGLFIPAEWYPSSEMIDTEYPFWFTTSRCIFHWDTGTMARKCSNIGDLSWVEINSTDAERLDIESGDPIRIITRDTALLAVAQITTEILPGTLFMPSHYVELETKELVQNTVAGRNPGSRPARIEKII